MFKVNNTTFKLKARGLPITKTAEAHAAQHLSTQISNIVMININNNNNQ